MASYIERVLIHDEKILYVAHITLWSLAHLILLGLVFILLGLMLQPLFGVGLVPYGLVPCGVGLVFLVRAFIRYKTTEIAITNKRVIAKFGFVSRHTIEFNMNKVESIQVNQGVLGRIFDYGSLIISGGGNPLAPIPGISRPLEFRRAFMEAQDPALKAGA